MAKLTKTNASKALSAKPETPMEKTTRIVKKMVDVDSEKQRAKNMRLRKARLERDASTPSNTAPKVERKTRKS